MAHVWDKVAAWKADYMGKKQVTAKATASVKPAPKQPAPKQPAPGPVDMPGDAAPIAGGNAFRFVKADLPAHVRAQLTQDAEAKGMKIVAEG